MTKDFWKSACIRAVRTIAQTALSMIGTTAVVMGDVNWQMIASASVLSGILSILTSIATGLPEVAYAEQVYMSAPEPEDSYVDEIEIPESEVEDD